MKTSQFIISFQIILRWRMLLWNLLLLAFNTFFTWFLLVFVNCVVDVLHFSQRDMAVKLNRVFTFVLPFRSSLSSTNHLRWLKNIATTICIVIQHAVINCNKNLLIKLSAENIWTGEVL